MHILERGKMLKYPYGVSTHGYLTHNHRQHVLVSESTRLPK